MILEVTIGTLIQRGFTLEKLCGRGEFSKFPDMKTLREWIRHSWSARDLDTSGKGYASARAACYFGFNTLNVRLAEEFLALLFNWHYCGSRDLSIAIEDALESYALSVGDRLVEYRAELNDAGDLIADLEEGYSVDVGEAMFEYSEQLDLFRHVLNGLQDKYEERRTVLQARLADLYIQIGY